MGGEVFSLDVNVEKKGAKLADGYRRCWWFLRNTLKDFRIDPGPAVESYLSEVWDIRTQQELQGRRPFSKTSFTFHFPGHAGLSACAAGLAHHWLKISFAILEDRLPMYLFQEGIRISGYPTIRDERHSARFIVLRGVNWEIETTDGITLYSQGLGDTETLNEIDLGGTEAEQVHRVISKGHCACSICETLEPSPATLSRMLAPDDPEGHTLHHVALPLWIASLQDPPPSVLRTLLSRAAGFYGKGGSFDPNLGTNSVIGSFALLGERTPEAWATLKEGLLGDEFARAMAVQALRSLLRNGNERLETHEDTFLAMANGSPVETIAVGAALLECNLSADSHGHWVPVFLNAMSDNLHYGAPQSDVLKAGMKVFDRLIPVGSMPKEVESFLQHVAATFNPVHPVAFMARNLLSVKLPK